jgi:hypothetical protein
VTNPTNAYTVPSVSITTARTGASAHANALGMRPMQERANEEFVTLLLAQAKSTAPRADIHTYIQFRCTEFEAKHIRRTLFLFAHAAGFIVATLVVAFSWKNMDFDVVPWHEWVLVTLYAALFALLLFQAFFTYKFRRLEAAWQAKVCSILYERAFRHVESDS